MAVVNGAPANRNQFVSPNFAHFNPYSVLGHEEVQRQQTHVEHEHQLQQQNDHILAQQLAQQEQVQQAQVLQTQQQQAQVLQAQQQQAQQAQVLQVHSETVHANKRPVITYGDKYVNNMEQPRVSQRRNSAEMPPRFQRLQQEQNQKRQSVQQQVVDDQQQQAAHQQRADQHQLVNQQRLVDEQRWQAEQTSMLEQQQRQAEQQRQVNQLLRANLQWHEQRLINQQQEVVPHQQVHQQYQQASVQRTQTTLEQRCLADQQRLLMQQRRQADQQCQADQVLQANQQRQAGHQVTQQQQETPVPRMRTTLVASDSMTRSIRVRTINNMLNANSLIHQEARKIEIDKFPGAHANKIRHCFQYSLQEFQPDTMVVIAGANDITYDSQAGNADAKQIAAKVTNIARDALAKGIHDVYVFGITQRRNKQFNQLIKQTNLEL